MPASPNRCDPLRLSRFLADELGDAEQHALEVHLEGCAACRTALETQSAPPETWEQARSCLLGSGFFPGEPIGDHGTASAAAVNPADNPETRDDDSHSLGEGRESTATLLAQVQAFLAPSDDPQMLGRLGSYEILGIIGQGGMGIVLKGLDRSLNRYAALKVLAPHLAASGAARRRFSREAQAAAAVVHENVIEIFGVSDVHGLPFLAMPYIRGPSLEKLIHERGPLELPEILRIGLQTAAGLAAAHAQGLIHRDVKPANILLADGADRVKLTDFGLARTVDDASLTRSGVIAGTPQYMSPEQARGEPIDSRSDLFSLGSVLYAMAAGRPPFRAETVFGILRKVVDGLSRPLREINPDVPEWLERLIARLHAKDPDDRCDSAEEVGRLLAGCLSHVQQPATIPLPAQVAALPPATPPTVDAAHPPRAVSPAWLAASAVAMLAAWLGWQAWNGRPGGRPSAENSATDASSAPGGSSSRSATGEAAGSSGDSAGAPIGADVDWNDGVHSDLLSTDRDVRELEQEVQEFWSTTPAALRSPSGPATFPSSESLPASEPSQPPFAPDAPPESASQETLPSEVSS